MGEAVVPLRDHLEALRTSDLLHGRELRAADQRALDIKDKADELAKEPLFALLGRLQTVGLLNTSDGGVRPMCIRSGQG